MIPTFLLGGLWLAFSIATWGYIAWLDRGYQKLVDEEAASLRHTGEIQGALWTLHDTVAAQLFDEIVVSRGMALTEGHQANAAEMLGLSRPTLRSKLRLMQDSARPNGP